MTSIRKYLIFILLSAITLINFLAALHGYRTSMDAAEKIFDEKLIQISDLLILTVNSDFNNRTINTSLIPTRSQGVIENQIFYQIWKDDQLIDFSQDASGHILTEFNGNFENINYDGYRWRALSKFYGDEKNKIWIVIAERIDVRFTLAESVIVRSVLPIVASLPLIALIIWFVVANGLKPLAQLTSQLSQKRADDLSPLTIKTVTVELSQLVDSANNLLRRLSDSFDREKRFASNAAHELRTPMSILRIHLYNLQQDLKEPNANFKELDEGLKRLEHLVEQILTLHRSSSENYLESGKNVCLYEIIQDSVSHLYWKIDNKNQIIELVGEEATCVVGDKFALSALITNLIDNASKYSPEKSEILVSVLSKETPHKKSIVLSVEDSGAGIPQDKYEQVFERFYRVDGDQHSSGEKGCGLGLSIVKHIVELHDAKISLSQSPSLGGLCVKIEFPVS